MLLEENQIVMDVYALLKHKSSIMYEVTQDLVQPTFNETIDTAQVSFSVDDEDVNVSFEFSPKFWESLNVNEKFFVFAHEVLHVLFFHGSRGKKFMESLPRDQRSRSRLNTAMDICINELVVREYVDVPMSSLPVLKDMMCNIANCFPNRQSEILRGKSFEYYYMELLQESSENDIPSFDLHEFLEGLSDEQLEKLDDAVKSVSSLGDLEKTLESDRLPTETQSYSEGDSATGPHSYKLETPQQKLEKHLDLFIASKFGGREPFPKYKNIWHKKSRRMTGVSYGNELYVPYKEQIPIKKGKHKLVVYADVSGSVASKSKMFMNLVGGLSESKFDVDIYAFASNVAKAQKKDGRITYSGAGGGTEIYKVIRHYKSNYATERPDATLVLTDGLYRSIKSLTDDFFADWVFFLTANRKNHPSASKSIILG